MGEPSTSSDALEAERRAAEEATQVEERFAYAKSYFLQPEKKHLEFVNATIRMMSKKDRRAMARSELHPLIFASMLSSGSIPSASLAPVMIDALRFGAFHMEDWGMMTRPKPIYIYDEDFDGLVEILNESKGKEKELIPAPGYFEKTGNMGYMFYNLRKQTHLDPRALKILWKWCQTRHVFDTEELRNANPCLIIHDRQEAIGYPMSSMRSIRIVPETIISDGEDDPESFIEGVNIVK